MQLKEKAISGAKHTLISSIVVSGTQFFQMLILARLLGPGEFGLVGMVMIIVGFAYIFQDAGMSNAIIHFQENSEKELSSLYWFNICCGALIFTILIIISPSLSFFFKEPKLKSLFMFAAFNFLIIPFGQQFQALFQKELVFKKIARIEIISTIAGAVLSIYLALKNHGAFSLIAGQLLANILKSTQLFLSTAKQYHPKLFFKISYIKKYLNFGLFQMGDMSLNYFNSRIDQLIVGKLFGATILGYYSIAYYIVLQPIMRINPIITRISFPLFAKIQDEKTKLGIAYSKTLKIITILSFPIFATLFVLGEKIVLFFYGFEWAIAGKILQIMSLGGLFVAAGNPVGALLAAKGRPDLSFIFNLVKSIINPLIIFMASFFGFFAMAWIIVLLQVAYFTASYNFFIKKILGNILKPWLVEAFLKSLSYSLLLGMILWMFFYKIKLSTGLLAIICLTGIIVYSLELVIFENKFLKEFSGIIFKQKRRETNVIG